MKKLARWSRFSPENIEHKWLLVRAEYRSVKGRGSSAATDYDRAIELAGEHGYIQEQALANELAARHYMHAGREKLARTYLGDAWGGYHAWGAVEKLRRLEKELPELTRGLSKRYAGIDTRSSSDSTTRVHSSVEDVDESTYVDAGDLVERLRDLRKELRWGLLLERIIGLGIEQTGASRGVLVLKRREHLVVEAEVFAEDRECRPKRSLLMDREDIARAVVTWVIDQGASVALGDAPSQGSFVRDAYIYTKRPRSILCVPLILGDRPLGALYLEHVDTLDLFRERSVTMVEMLAEEAASALDNAMKYKLLAEEKRDLEMQLKAFTEDQQTIIEKNAEED
jgi:hypothetical protein